MSIAEPSGRTRPNQINHRTETPGVYYRNGYYVVLVRPDGDKKVRHRFETYEDAVAFKATTPNRHTRRISGRRKPGKAGGNSTLSIAYLRDDPCAYCGAPGTDLDHIVPRVGGGTDDWTNLTSACNSCNSRKQRIPLLLFLAREHGCWQWRGRREQATPKRGIG